MITDCQSFLVSHCRPAPAIQSASLITPEGGYTFGTFAQYECNTGYVADNSDLVCVRQEDVSQGVWIGVKPDCQLSAATSK